MILLTSLLHREDLKEIILRWMSNRFEYQDCQRIKEIVNFNIYIIKLYLDAFAGRLFRSLVGVGIWNLEVSTKGELRDLIIDAAPYTSDRLEFIRTRYRTYPEDFYRATPFRGTVYCNGSRENPTYLGHSRVKRFRRVADKVARRMVDVIFHEIKKRADSLALERASRLGISKDRLVTPLEEQREEFSHAERRFIKQVRAGLFRPDEHIAKSAVVHDVAGVKVVIEDEKRVVLERLLDETAGCRIMEKEQHTGMYDAANYIVELRLDKKELIDRAPDSRIVDVLAARSIDRDTIIEAYKTFVHTAEEDVYFEVIASNYPEMIESEFGRSMHEEMILAQREEVEYRSSIATNVRYLTEYLFLFAVSGKKGIDELPIKLWEKAMPDIYDDAISNLWDIPTMPVL